MSILKETLKATKQADLMEITEENYKVELIRFVKILGDNLDINVDWLDLIPKNINEALVLISAREKGKKRMRKNLLKIFKNLMAIF